MLAPDFSAFFIKIILELNGLCVPLILSLFGVFLLLELLRLTRYYRKLRPIAGYIEQLTKSVQELSFPVKTPEQIWFSNHFIGSYHENGDWVPRKRQHYFLLTVFPMELTDKESNSLRFAPGLLTTLGILGTFLGITQGMPEQMQFGASEQLLDVSTELLKGMKTAFTTSLVGLATAAILTITQAFMSWLKNVRRVQIYNQLHRISLRETPTSLLAQINSEDQKSITETQKQAALSMQQSSKALQTASMAMAEGVSQFNPAVIGEKVSQSLEKVFHQQLTPVFAEIRDELKQLREIKEDNGQEILKELIGQLRSEVLEPMSERIDQSTRTTERAAQAVEHLHEELGGIAKELSGAVTTIQTFQIETMGQLRGFADEMRSILTQFQNDTHATLETIGQSINEALAKSIEGLAIQRDAFESSANQAANTFRGIKEELRSALQERAAIEKQTLDETQNRINQTLVHFQQSFNDQTASLEKVGLEAKQLMQEVQNHLKESMTEVTLGIKTALDQSIEGMGLQRDAFESSANQAANTFRGIREELEQALVERSKIEQQVLNETRDGITAILNEAQQAFAEQSETLRDVGEHASNLMASAELKLTNTLTNIDDVLAKATETVKSQLEVFRKEYQDNLNAFFEQQNNLLEATLGEQRDGLMNVVTSLDEVFQEEYFRRLETIQEIEKQFFSLQDSAKIIQELVEATGMSKAAHWDQLKDATRSIGTQIGHLESQYSQASERFTAMTEQVPKALGDYLERSKDSQIKFCQDLDAAASKVHNTLAAAAECLVAAEQDRRLHKDSI